MKITAVTFVCHEDGERTEKLAVLPGFHSMGFGEYFRWAHPLCRFLEAKPHLINTEEIVGSNNFLDLYNRWRECEACPLGDKRKKKVFYRGDLEAPLVFIGEAPGEEENRYGTPFVGRAGVLLDSMIEGAGLEPEFVLIVNPVLCRPTDEEGKNRRPTPEEVSVCVSHLNQILSIAKRRAYVLLGDTAKRTFGVTAPLNSLLPFGAAVYHPSYFLRKGAPETSLKEFDKAVAIIKKAAKIKAKAFPPANGLVLEAIKHSRWTKWESIRGGDHA